MKCRGISALSLMKGPVQVRRPVHCNKNNIGPLGLLKTFVIPQMEDVNIYAADDGQLETLR